MTTLAIHQHVADYRAGKISGLELSGTFDVLADWLADPEYGGMREWIGGGVVAEWDKQLGDWLAVPGPDRRAEYAATPWTCPPHLARLVAWRLRMGDERWHGTEDCPECAEAFMYHSGREARTYCASCEGSNRIPTFALLFDRPGDESCQRCGGEGTEKGHVALGIDIHGHHAYGRVVCSGCNGTGKRTIPGHLSELIAWLRASGDAGKADEIAAISWCRIVDRNGTWTIYPATAPTNLCTHATYPDACRELLRRVGEVLCSPCRQCGGGYVANWAAKGWDSETCPQCHGLGFVGRVEERAVRVS